MASWRAGKNVSSHRSSGAVWKALSNAPGTPGRKMMSQKRSVKSVVRRVPPAVATLRGE
jgi:hypothetical protein